MFKKVYTNNSPDMFASICDVCKKECTVALKVTDRPIFVSRSFNSSYRLSKFLDTYNKYHDFDIVSQHTTNHYSTGLFGFSGYSSLVYSITLKNK